MGALCLIRCGQATIVYSKTALIIPSWYL